LNLAEDLRQSLEALKNGGIIVYPTDTIWGLGCDATNPAAVQKIFSIKLREEGKSLLVLVNSIGMLERYVKEIPRTALELVDISDSPLTIVYPGGRNLAEGVCAADGSVGIRICNDDFCKELITRFRKPVVSTSANFSGNPSPSNFFEIDRKLLEKADYVVNHRRGDRQKRAASPVIRVETDGSLKIIRK
jgi:L-threonylcarbamoyladenylate synthase